jgi:hypothetical protein
MPAPRDRDDLDYFAPLSKLDLDYTRSSSKRAT